MLFILALVLVCTFVTDGHAAWTWVAWTRLTSREGQQAYTSTEWREEALFQDQSPCREYIMAIVSFTSERWKDKEKTGGEILILVQTKGKDIGFPRGVQVLLPQENRMFVIEWLCLPLRARLRPSPEREW
jgi:hypothetical protein